MPLWVKVTAGVALAVIVLLVLVLAFGPGEHGPSRHGPQHAEVGSITDRLGEPDQGAPADDGMEWPGPRLDLGDRPSGGR